MAESGRYRRPGERWCTDTAIRLVQIASREPFRDDARLDYRTAVLLLRAAKALDAFGQRLAAVDD